MLSALTMFYPDTNNKYTDMQFIILTIVMCYFYSKQ